MTIRDETESERPNDWVISGRAKLNIEVFIIATTTAIPSSTVNMPSFFKPELCGAWPSVWREEETSGDAAFIKSHPLLSVLLF
ncbi:hypothetical protein GCM10010917_10020 [Paenibacillus physcomitrellae]|uniref:Uncharacterized protein n=1 Tax=Paenibacillus physcomitrellae TaxID=1619311 RepID=A0ABQ1FS27_9BACL|nr:hypothetical protein GCM10010917_10020 [Paenibacillus physcomitrellae]